MRGQAVQTVTRRLVGQQTLSESSLWSHPGLLAVCIALPMIEVGLLWGVGLTSALGIAPGVTAPVPFATFHDLRWLMVYHRSWLGFAIEGLALLAFRGALTALLVRLAWPGGVARPSPAVLTRGGAALSASPAGLRLPVAAAAGLFNAWAWNGIVNVLALAPQVPRRAVPLVPIALVLLLAVVAVGAGLGFRANVSHGASSLSRAPYASGGRPVLLVSGFGGHWDGVPRRWLPGDLDERRFSYRGQSPGGQPLPYDASDTHDTLPELVRTMRDQVEAFHRQSGQKVAIVAESEGALVAKTYLAATPGAPVDELVMLSPLVQPARVWYPVRGASGWGLASGWELRELGGLFRDLSGADMSADMPVVRSLIDHGPAVRDLLACPLPDTRQLALFPLAEAVATPHPSQIGIPSEVVPAFHGGLLADDRVRQAVSTYLEDGKVAPATVWPVAQEILRASAAAWQVPELPLTLNQDWNGPAGRSPSCDAMAASLREWLR